MPANTSGTTETTWRLIGTGADHLLREITQLYWIGVERELGAILSTLREWQRPELESYVLTDETDGIVRGFDNFLDRIDAEHGKCRAAMKPAEPCTPQATDSSRTMYIQALEQRLEKAASERKSVLLRRQIRQALDDYKPEQDSIRRRARMLLRASGLLDIDKLIERSAPGKRRLGIRPIQQPRPQLALKPWTGEDIPMLRTLRCVRCHQVIRGSMYCPLGNNGTSAGTGKVCEDCYYKMRCGMHDFVKLYKHSIIPEIATSSQARICVCAKNPAHDHHKPEAILYDKYKQCVNRGLKTLVSDKILYSMCYDPTRLEEKWESLQRWLSFGESQNHVSTFNSRQENRRLSHAYRQLDPPEYNWEERDVERRRRYLQFHWYVPHKPDQGIEAYNILFISPFFVQSHRSNSNQLLSFSLGHISMALQVGPLVIECNRESYVSPALLASAESSAH
jgi:hypothetical protein